MTAVPERLFVFALRDTLPLDGGIGPVWTHEVAKCPPGCFGRNGTPGGAGCRGQSVLLVQRPRVDTGLAASLAALSDTTDEILGMDREGSTEAPPPSPGNVTVALVSVPLAADDDPAGSFETAFRAAQRVVDAVCIATHMPYPPLTIQRTWPFQFVIDRLPDGSLELSEVLLEERAFRSETPEPADEEQLSQVPQILRDANAYTGQISSPVIRVNALHIRASAAAHNDGDYMAAALFAATACEIFLKHMASMLVWEESTYRNSPARWAQRSRPPLQTLVKHLLEQVLTPALGDYWAHGQPDAPLWFWDEKVVQLRHRVVHEAYRPSEDDIEAAVHAIPELLDHGLSQIARHAQSYPRTASMLLSREELRKRGAEGKVLAAHRSAAEKGEIWSEMYERWVREQEEAHRAREAERASEKAARR